MVMKAEPLCRALEQALKGAERAEILCPSPQGELFTQEKAEALAREETVIFICGHYKAIDERVFELFPVKELSVGDYVLSGGELPALVFADSMVRLVPGVLGDENSAAGDSFSSGVLDCSYYTRPEVFRSLRVPDALLSGNHERIRKWRRIDALRRTYERRPDLLDRERLSHDERKELDHIIKELKDETRQ